MKTVHDQWYFSNSPLCFSEWIAAREEAERLQKERA